jgi:hypothetical protein
MTRRDAAKRIAPRAALFVWFAVMLAIGATLMARHAVALPRPEVDADFTRAMSTFRTPRDAGRWMAVHVLYAECRCSQRIADHLLATTRPADVVEQVLLVGHGAEIEARLVSHGFRVTVVEPEQLAERYHVVAVPLFVVVAPDGTIRYAGGYTTRKQGPDPRDLELIAAAKTDGPLDALPIFGCPVNEQLAQTLNPLGLP